MAITSHAKPALHVSGSDGISTGTDEGDSTRTDPNGQLSDQEAAILQKQVEPATVNEITWKALLRFASRQDITIITISSICAIAAGAAIPLNTVILGSLAGSFQDFVNGLPRAEFDEVVKRQTLFFVYLAIGEFAATYVSSVGFIYAGDSITRKIREQYLKAVLKQNAAFFDNLGPGEIITRISSDTNVIQEGMSEKIELALSSVSIFAAAYVIGFIKYWKLTLILTVMTPVLFGTLHILIKFIIKYSKLSLAAYAQSGTVVEETLSSIRTVTAFGSQERLARDYNACLTRAGVFGLRMKCVAGSVPGFAICLFNLGYALASWLGSKYIVSGETNLSAVLTILLAVMLGAYSFGKAAQHFQAFGNALGAAARIYATIDRAPPFSAEDNQGRRLEGLAGCIEFRNVKHVYPSRPDVVVLQNLNLVIPAGKTVAITGASGSGKSTIVALIERFYDPVAGMVLIDGCNIESLNLSWLRRQIGLVSQDPALFSGTVEENILLGLKGTKSRHEIDGTTQRTLAEQAARLANAHEFIEQLPQGYDTHVGERGSFLSGGQRQRVAIARAVVSQPKILLFDEATSALDSKTEGVVQAALEKAARGRTTLVIAHRLSTIKNADSIVVFAPGGEILEQGTYEELIAKQAAFHQLLEAQRMTPQPGQPQDNGNDHQYDEKDHRLPDSKDESISVNCNDVSTSSLEEKSARKAVDATTTTDGQEKIANYSLWSLIKFTASLNRQEWKIMLLGLIASIISGAGEPVQCVILAKCISTLSLPPSQYHRLRSETNFWSGMFFMIAIVMLISCLTMGVSFAYGSERLVRRCRDRAFRAILRQDIQFFDRKENSVGALTSFLGVETTHLAGMSAIALGTIFQLIATLLIAYIIALAVGWKLALVCISTVPILLLAGFLNFWTLARFEAYLKEAYRESASYACEATSSTRTIASLTLESEVCQRYHNLLIAQSRKSFRFNLKSGILYAASQSLGFLCMALCFWYGSHLLGDYSISQFYLVFFTVIFGTRSAANMCSQSNNMAKAKVAASELKTLFDRTPTIDIWSSEGDVLKNMQGSVEFRDVDFAYKQGQPVLNGLNFKVMPGQYVALVGASGSGKSTIIALLERFYDPTSGGVYVDGKDISGLDLSEYRKHLALVSQEPTLYQGTIRENILIGIDDEDVPEDRVVKVCKEANIYDFIASLPTGFDTVVGSKGIMLSGGQKQRVAIARALLRDPKILLLDEATSSLDSESELVVQTALDAASKGRTTIAVAHRLSTVRNADVIYVVDGGRIVESGAHAALMSQRGRYFELVQLQSLENQDN